MLLFITSIYMVPFIIISHDPKKYLYALSAITSLLNHGYRTRTIQILDRSVMVIGAIIDYQYINNYDEIILYYLSIICYFSSKIIKKPIFHGMAHMFITLLHSRLLISS